MPTPSFTPGQRVTLQRVVHRAPHLQPSIEEVVVDVALWQPEHDLLFGHELSRFSYLSGYREHGRDIGARNPYDDDGEWRRSDCFASGGRNGYFVAPEHRNLCGEWTVVPQPPQAKPARPAMSTSPGPLQPASLVCCRDGSISAIDGAFICPDFPDIDDFQDDDPIQSEILQHIDSAGIAVTSLVSAVTGIHQLLDGQECGSDTIASIIEILQDQLGLEIRDPFHTSEPPAA